MTHARNTKESRKIAGVTAVVGLCCLVPSFGIVGRENLVRVAIIDNNLTAAIFNGSQVGRVWRRHKAHCRFSVNGVGRVDLRDQGVQIGRQCKRGAVEAGERFGRYFKNLANSTAVARQRRGKFPD